ncbi:MAG TPA: pilus assembly protein TadG-related protein [Sphingomicrobium sp.]|nr:pilus assembly protein TadG-related protein [Sphingomicrobium sp.]
MISLFRKLWKNKRGNALVIGAAALPMIVACAGLASDTIQWTLWKRQLQRAADSAAMSGVYTRLKDNTQTAVNDAVTHDNTLNLHTWMALNASPTVELLSDSGQMKYPVRVTLTVQQRLPFSSMFMTAAPTITAVSTAASVPAGGEYCVIGLDPSAKVTGVNIAGSTYLDLGDCSLIANSTNPTTAASNGSSSANGGNGSTVKAASLAAAGGVNYSANWTVGSYNPYSSPVDDPFYSLKDSIPTSTSACNKTGVSIGGQGNIDRTTGSDVDTAGQIVCLSGNQTIQSNVKLGPATYVINAGNLTMNSTGSSLTCDGCTIILTNFSNPANTGSMKLTGGTLSLKPPREVTNADGSVTDIGNQTWKGIVLYQDPRATDDGKTAPENQVTGNSATSVQGVVYTGNQSLLFNGGGSDVAACLQVVAKRVTFSGNSKIKAASQCGSYGLNAIGGGRRVRLVG